MASREDTSRGGSGSIGNRRSLAQLLRLDIRQTDPPANAPASTSSNDFTDNEWTLQSPSSPEVAQTPRALVPPACFPPTHSRDYASYSESAQPGGWNESDAGQGMEHRHGTDLVASMRTLGINGSGPIGGITSPPTSAAVSCSRRDRSGDANRIPNRRSWHASMSREDRITMPSRRSSYCGPGNSMMTRGQTLLWSGVLPARAESLAGEISPTLFLGGLPWDISESALMHALRHFHPICMDWPGRDCGLGSGTVCPRGYAYLTLGGERRVRELLAECRRDRSGFYYKLRSRRFHTKQVQVIPWVVSDANWMSVGSARLAATRTVFVGALHGTMCARALAHVMNELFSGVIYAGIDTDKNKYPIGSGRVTFDNVLSYLRAISAAFIEIRTDRFIKKVQVDPYLEDSMCSVCKLQQGPYFCREPMCFGYFCRSCWSWQHTNFQHKALTRKCNCVERALPSVVHAQPPVGHELPPVGNAQPPVGHELPPVGNALPPDGHARHSPPGDHGSPYSGSYPGPRDGTPPPRPACPPVPAWHREL